jgi:hypothetical protein
MLIFPHLVDLVAMARLVPGFDGQVHRGRHRVLRKVAGARSSICSVSTIPLAQGGNITRLTCLLSCLAIAGAALPPRSSRTTTRPLTFRTSRRSAERLRKVCPIFSFHNTVHSRLTDSFFVHLYSQGQVPRSSFVGVEREDHQGQGWPRRFDLVGPLRFRSNVSDHGNREPRVARMNTQAVAH